MDHRNGRWARQLLALQNEDGTWGSTFHTLTAADRGRTVTTEQALRRLKALGFTLEDGPIRRAVDTMTACLRGDDLRTTHTGRPMGRPSMARRPVGKSPGASG